MSKRTPGGLPPLNPPRKKRRGFAALKERDPERLREIARKGGAAVPAHLRSFAQDRALAVEAGTAGGKAHAYNTGRQSRLSAAEEARLRRLKPNRNDE